jgi:thiol-disulfide isomerase/thioredoxin
MIKFTLLVIILFEIHVSCHCQYSFKLSGENFHKFENEKIFLSFRDFENDATFEVRDSARIINGAFEIQGFLLNPAALSTLFIERFRNQYVFILDTGKITVRLSNKPNLSRLIINDSETNLLFQNINRIYDINILNGKPIGNQSMREIRLKELNLIRNHKLNFYSVIALHKMVGRPMSISDEEIESTLRSLDTSILNTRLGEYVSSMVYFSASLEEGNKFPVVSFYDTNLTTINPILLNKRIYVIAFGATWCGPCKKQLPELVKLSYEYSKECVQFVYINMDSDYQKWKTMISDYNMNSFLNFSDINNRFRSKMNNSLFIKLLPTYLIIDENGIIRYNSTQVKNFDLASLRNFLNKLAKS